MKPIPSLTLAAAFLAGTAAGLPAAVLFTDNFDANTPNTTDINVGLGRQTGTLAPIAYTLASGQGHYGHQLQNVNAPNQLLLADFPNSTTSLNLNCNNIFSAGGLKISFDVDSIPTVYGGTADNWGCINLGASQSDQLVNVNGAQTHFGILFRGAGTLQAFDGSAVVSPSPEPVYSTRPAGTTNHIDLVITDADGNPFDGVGNTTIEVFANGGPLPVWTYTKVGGYANNYINLQGSFRAHMDNFTIEQLSTNRAPVVVNPSFEADNFTVFPGYVSGNGPITGWTSLGNHGVNPGSFGGPFSDNGAIPDGAKTAFLQGNGVMSQVISGFSIGSTYQIRYAENARNCCGGTPSVEVKIGGQTVVASHASPPVTGANPYRDVISEPFTATSTAMELAFIKGEAVAGDSTLLIDHVRVIAPGTPPSITAQPQDTTVALGDTATIAVGAAGSPPLTYQWYFGTSPVTGGTSAALPVVASSANVAGDYRVVVANSSGSVTSRVAKLTVRAKVPGLFNTGVGASGAALDDASVDPHYHLIVNADGPSTDAIVHSSTIFPIVAGPWMANTATSKWIGPRADTSGAAGLAQGNGTYVYRTTFDLTGLDRNSVLITGGWAIDNTGVSIKVNGQATGLVNNNGFGAATTFTLNSANAAFVDGVNTLDFEVQNVDAVAGYTALRVVELRGTATLPGTPPTIEQQPRGGIAGTGESFTFSVLAIGSSPLAYQWRKNGSDIAGANGPAYTIASAQKSDAGDYTVFISNPAGNLTSAVAALQVRDTVPGFFNTGVDDARNALGDGATDPHYQIVVNPDSTSPDAIIENSAAFPIVAGPWVANNAGSKWIGPRFDTAGAAGAVGVGGDYTYRTVVDLAGFDPATIAVSGVWATDNDGVDIFVNGQSSGRRNTVQFNAFTAFTLNSGFLAGPNVIEFKVNNSAAGYTGLRVDQIRVLGDALPAGTQPFIVTQPQGASLAVGQTARFTVRANGSGPLSYQWYYGPDPIPDATSATYAFPIEFPDATGDYSVEITNPFGSVRSVVARLTVLAEPVILEQPRSLIVAVGDSATFTVSAIGEPPLTYQWLKNGQPIPGAEQTSYTIGSVTADDVGSYTVEIANFSGSATSSAATLTLAELAPGLFNTGVDASGVSLPSGSVDPHWTIAASIDPAFPGPDALVLNDIGFPIPPWLANDEISKWIAPRADQSGGNLEGDYVYRTTFNLSGFDPASVVITGEWATDNFGTDILINGTSTGQRNDSQFVTWTPFRITSGIVRGLNTLEFKVNNAPTGVNPTGFRVRNLRALGVRANACPTIAAVTPITVNSGATATGQLQGSDADGDTLSYVVVSVAQHGTVTLTGATGAFSYAPNAGYTGPDSFTAAAVDPSGCRSDAVTVSITVAGSTNRCPTAIADIGPAVELFLCGAESVIIAGDYSNWRSHLDEPQAKVLLDGRDSTDPDGQVLTMTWFSVEENGALIPLAMGAETNVVLEPGLYTIRLVVDDGQCQDTMDVDIHIISPSEAIDAVIQDVKDGGLGSRNRRPLISLLKSASACFDRGLCDSGVRQLQAFIRKVQAQIEPEKPELAQYLIGKAQEVLDHVDCGQP